MSEPSLHDAPGPTSGWQHFIAQVVREVRYDVGCEANRAIAAAIDARSCPSSQSRRRGPSKWLEPWLVTLFQG